MSVRLVHITTSPLALRFLRGQPGFLRQHGFEVAAISSPGDELCAFAESEGVPITSIEMPRRITPRRDLVALWKLARELRRQRPTIVHAHTPKGGLLGMLGALLARVPARIYHLRGLPYMTATGRRRQLLMATERISCRIAHRVICVSPSLREVAIRDGICPPEKITVLAGGSGQGVDANGRFDPGRFPAGHRCRKRAELGISTDARVIGYVGRIVRDKGIHELAAAWTSLRERYPDLHLVLAGPLEPQDPIDPMVLRTLRGDTRVHLTGWAADTSELYPAFDVVVLPTYREGFPNVPLEAAAMRLPVVATQIPGCVDAVADGGTGTLVPSHDAAALEMALARYLDDAVLRLRHGEAGRDRVLAAYRPEAIREALLQEYEALVRGRGVLLDGGGGGVCRLSARLRLKRLLDIVVSAAALAVLSPVIAIVALLVRVRLGSPVLFRQVRPGHRGQPFTLMKFRTMSNTRDAAGNLLPDADRLTSVGRSLRRYSLDELPQFWNVLRGDMSLVGPRPLLMEYLNRYSPEQARRHDVKPGLTGLAQISGRNAIPWERKFDLDVWYATHWSLWLDLRILARTVRMVTRGHGVWDRSGSTAPSFIGTIGAPDPCDLPDHADESAR